LSQYQRDSSVAAFGSKNKREKRRKIILNGWKAAGRTGALESAREGSIPTLDPFLP